MTKKDQIAALEADVDRLRVVVAGLSDRIRALEWPVAVVRPQSLVDRAKSELHGRWDDLMQGLGL